MRLNNGGVSRRSFVYIADAVEATRLVMEKGAAGEIFHIASDRLSTIREVAEMTALTAGKSLKDIADIGPGRLGRDSVYNLDSSKIRQELGWKDTISLEDGVEETVKWVRDNINELCGLPLAYMHQA